MSFKGKTIITSLALILIFMVGNAWAEMLSIDGEKVNIRSGPGSNYRVKYEYGQGFPLKVVSSKGQWVKVQDFENDIGWVHRDLLKKKGTWSSRSFGTKTRRSISVQVPGPITTWSARPITGSCSRPSNRERDGSRSDMNPA